MKSHKSKSNIQAGMWGYGGETVNWQGISVRGETPTRCRVPTGQKARLGQGPKGNGKTVMRSVLHLQTCMPPQLGPFCAGAHWGMC